MSRVMAIQDFMSVKGAKQGQFKGESIAKRNDKWMDVLSFTMGLKLPGGKREFDPITIVKEWGAASPQGLTACATNEALPEVVIEFTRSKPTGETYVKQIVKLTGASIVQIVRFRGIPDTTWGTSSSTSLELERWSFKFSKIEVEDSDGKTTYTDDWLASPARGQRA